MALDFDRLQQDFAEGGVPALEARLAATPPSVGWLAELVEGVVESEASVPASWLLRAALERGEELDRTGTAALLRGLDGLTADDARLHLCQLVRHLDVPARNAEQLARFLRSGIEGGHKFTRAWAVDGFQRLASQHAKYRAEARRALDRALRDPAASVRARARHIAAEFD